MKKKLNQQIKLISIIVPCYNECEVIQETHNRLCKVMNSLNSYKYEIIYIDDGSIDKTWSILEHLYNSEKNIQIIQLSRNFGHQMALTCGVKNANGKAMVIIDADLQDPPEVIPRMIEKWEQGYNVIYGVRKTREGETWFKKFSATIFYKLLKVSSKIEIPSETGDFRLIDNKVKKAFLNMPEKDRFVRGMISWIGYKQTSIQYERHPRFLGSTKYPLRKMLEFALDGIISFSIKPLRLVTFFGFIIAIFSFGLIIYVVIGRFFGSPVPGWSALLSSILFLGGIQLISLGLIGEYIGRIYGEVKNRPNFLISIHKKLK